MSLVISNKEPRYQFIPAAKTHNHLQHSPHLQHLPHLPRVPHVTPCHIMTIDQWEHHYRCDLIEMCDTMFDALCSADIEGYTMVLNKNILYNRLVRMAYPASYNTSRTMRDILRNN